MQPPLDRRQAAHTIQRRRALVDPIMQMVLATQARSLAARPRAGLRILAGPDALLGGETPAVGEEFAGQARGGDPGGDVGRRGGVDDDVGDQVAQAGAGPGGAVQLCDEVVGDVGGAAGHVVEEAVEDGVAQGGDVQRVGEGEEVDGVGGRGVERRREVAVREEFEEDLVAAGLFVRKAEEGSGEGGKRTEGGRGLVCCARWLFVV